jgi:hypothetical protein
MNPPLYSKYVGGFLFTLRNFSKILPQHFPVRFRLLCGPAAFQIIPALLRLLAREYHGLAEQEPVREDIQVLHLKKTNPGIVGDNLVVTGPCCIMPLRLIVRA